MNKKHILGIIGVFFSFISVVHAQVTDVFSAELTVYTIIGRLELLLWAVAIAAFFWGLIKFMANAGDTAEHQQGKELIVWGLISFVVLVSIWGIVQLIAGDTFGYVSGPVNYIDKNGGVVM